MIPSSLKASAFDVDAPIGSDRTGPDQYREKGRSCEAAQQWASAVDCYYRTLSCLPGVLGVGPWLQQYLLDDKCPAFYSHREIGEIYAAIGRCMFAMERFDDARLNCEASLDWHPNGQDARQLLGDLKKLTAVPSPTICAQAQETTDDGKFIRNRVTLLLVTHYTRKLIKYRELAPPSTRLLTATCGSMIDVFGLGLTACPKIVCYDRVRPEGRRGSDSYLTALNQFCRKFQFNLHVFNQAGLLNILKTVATMVTTPYIFLVEHDWLFESGPISLRDVIFAMDRHDDIHMIRFNKRRNAISHYDFILEKEIGIKEIPLLRTSAHSNNPSLIRTNTLKNIWLPICIQDAYFLARHIKGTAQGIEQPLMKSHMRSIRYNGFAEAHSQWGGYVFGHVGDHQRLIHLGE